MSYSLLILVFSFCSSMSFLEIYRAASSREITLFQLTNNPMNYLHSTPKDFSFFNFLSFIAIFGESSSKSEKLSVFDKKEWGQLEDMDSNRLPTTPEVLLLLLSKQMINLCRKGAYHLQVEEISNLNSRYESIYFYQSKL